MTSQRRITGACRGREKPYLKALRLVRLTRSDGPLIFRMIGASRVVAFFDFFFRND
jgi:hypothetical protein